MFDNNNRFVMEDYQQKPPFSSFLPGIAGPKGIPAWVYYNNRGQGVCSFGAMDKDHAIMEFCAAHTAYQNNARTGFRTFCRVNGQYEELFTASCDMHIGAGEMEIFTRTGNLAASALYFGLPGERAAALVRRLTVENITDSVMELELLDGMPAIVSYGVGNDALKQMAQLSKAWMQAEDMETGKTCFRVRASMADTAVVTRIEGVNFCLGMDQEGALLRPLVQPSIIFGEDTGLAVAGEFAKKGLETLCAVHQVAQNLFPCCFLPRAARLAPGEKLVIYSLYGQAESKERFHAFAQKVTGPAWFEKKREEAKKLTDDLAAAAYTHTADPVFDAYSGQTYIDNLLRGGVPYFFRDGEKTAPFYLYSRKHGDPEREYNYFSVGKEYYAQGNGNFRDVNQNRRCDILYHPQLGDNNIRTFFELIQSDGYNPLVVNASSFTLTAEEAASLVGDLPAGVQEKAVSLLSKPFTPGQLAMAAEDWGLDDKAVDAFTARCVCAAHSEPNATFGEGCWSDHWTYNLDLIESYLSVWPEKKQELLLGKADYRWFETRVFINPRAKRYEMTPAGLRQYHALDEERKAGTTHKWMQTAKGGEARSTLMEKLILLCTIKAATLDAAGMGVEMEGGKPGWYDALNGLPGLFGSSMPESCELARILRFTIEALEEQQGDITMYTEMAELLKEVSGIFAAEKDLFARWDKASLCREDYRSRTADGISGEQTQLKAADVAGMLRVLEEAVLDGISRAVSLCGGICPTYFSFRAEDVTETAEGPMPGRLVPEALPLFLEGPVRWLKLSLPVETKAAMAAAVRESGLYDQKLHMYKVNENLDDVSFEVGRTRAFTRGWLENESIWLHMEYKYLLELLKSGLWQQFADAFHDAAVPFLDPAVYGRSPLENVSFIASSANPDPAIHGRGFVARLSGSTAEFLQIRQLMFFGAHPFQMDGEDLCLTFAPCVPAYLMPEDGVVSASFLDGVLVHYHAAGKQSLVPGQYQITGWTLTHRNGTVSKAEGCKLNAGLARAVRDGQVTAIDVTIQ